MGKLRDQQVLVTGAEGFIGSHLVERLVAAGDRVRALSQYNSFNNWGWLEDLHCLHQIEVVSGEIRDPHFCYDVTRGIAVVFHLAALIPIPYSYRAPDRTIAPLKLLPDLPDTKLPDGIAAVLAALRSTHG
jgi:nucleoside-diphosphate-sugar epimerase